jgi:crotonobetainyl-CoA:carnitine CoA-transferase CaiB-like acyl-CoA transferase
MSALFEGLRVVEIASFVFAPGAGTVMADFGAEVIHVEPPGIGDPMRVLYKLRPLPESEENYCWMHESRNKKSIVLDLKQAAGHDVAVDLIRSADVLITNYQPSVLNELNLSYETVRKINPRLIFAHATGYGEAGDEVEKPGYDATAWWARSGMMNAVRPADAELAMSTAAMGDHPSSISLLAGISMALYAREKSGEGTKVSSSLMANGVWSNSLLIQSALCGAPPYLPPTQATTSNAMLNHYRTSDGQAFFLLLIKEADEFGTFCDAIGREDLARDVRFAELSNRRANSQALVAILSELFASQPLSYWRKLLDEHSITFGIIASNEEVVTDPQMHANDVFAEFADSPGQQVVNSPISLADYPKVAPLLPPTLGQHSDEILTSLGYDENRVRTLKESGAVVGKSTL